MKEKKDSCQTFICHLICQVREGYQEAFGELLKIFEPLFLALLSRPEIRELNEQDIEDLQQELSVVFYHSILSYELDQSEVSFGLYAKICMSNALSTQLRKLRKQKTSLPLGCEEDESIIEALEGGENPFEEIVIRETMETMNKKIESELSGFETKVWKMYLMGNSAKHIANALGKTEKSIENAIFRLRRKLRDLFKTET